MEKVVVVSPPLPDRRFDGDSCRGSAAPCRRICGFVGSLRGSSRSERRLQFLFLGVDVDLMFVFWVRKPLGRFSYLLNALGSGKGTSVEVLKGGNWGRGDFVSCLLVLGGD
ncbi:hypothetical protein HPP92_012887 [Vanilla planifolia]|uniref:Uncharacterized protein n=1 Tax=Vanilla planifolia TaxID=51239 RepID=A0A835QMD8_VANPL|nr:hypothetical protein HPP92_012887 [Vanilla planifolia]